MLKKDPNYRRLKLGRAGLASTSSFWQAPDHLLVVEVAGTVEKYRRFYFRDIQAVIIQKSKVRMLWTISLAVGLLLMLLILFQVNWSPQSDEAPVFFIFLTVVLVLIITLVMNLLRGPTCVVLLRTAVQTQILPNINRRKKAIQLVEQLGPAIIAAQTTPATSPAPGVPTESAAAAENNPSGPLPA